MITSPECSPTGRNIFIYCIYSLSRKYLVQDSLSWMHLQIRLRKIFILYPDQMPKPPQWTPSNAQKYFYPKHPCYEWCSSPYMLSSTSLQNKSILSTCIKDLVLLVMIYKFDDHKWRSENRRNSKSSGSAFSSPQQTWHVNLSKHILLLPPTTHEQNSSIPKLLRSRQRIKSQSEGTAHIFLTQNHSFGLKEAYSHIQNQLPTFLSHTERSWLEMATTPHDQKWEVPKSDTILSMTRSWDLVHDHHKQNREQGTTLVQFSTEEIDSP